MTSHEFKTPLATILSSTELLTYYSDRLLQPQKKEILASIGDAVKRMTQMVDRVLFIGRSDADMLEFKPQRTNIIVLCESLADEALQESATESAVLERSFEPEIQGWFDEKLLRHALGNLLSNAIKYSRSSGKVIKFSVKAVGINVQVDIVDQGIGIPAADLPKVFSPFHRASNVGTLPGTGLGLSIVKRSVLAHGGKISVESEEGNGTRFTVLIPVGSPLIARI
jgi:signal transduction histidine kinase